MALSCHWSILLLKRNARQAAAFYDKVATKLLSDCLVRSHHFCPVLQSPKGLRGLDKSGVLYRVICGRPTDHDLAFRAPPSPAMSRPVCSVNVAGILYHGHFIGLVQAIPIPVNINTPRIHQVQGYSTSQWSPLRLPMLKWWMIMPRWRPRLENMSSKMDAGIMVTRLGVSLHPCLISQSIWQCVGYFLPNDEVFRRWKLRLHDFC